MYVTDFFLSDSRTILECWRSASRRGVALNWVEKNACYVDMKFRRIKEAYPDVKCVALVEVMQADPDKVRGYVGAVMEHADILTCSLTEFAEELRKLSDPDQESAPKELIHQASLFEFASQKTPGRRLSRMGFAS